MGAWVSWPDRPAPKFAGQILPDRTESGLIFSKFWNKCLVFFCFSKSVKSPASKKENVRILKNCQTYHTDPVCEFFSKNCLMAKLLQNNSNLNDFEYSRHLKVRKIEKKAKKIFEDQTKARGQKTQIFTIFWTFKD